MGASGRDAEQFDKAPQSDGLVEVLGSHKPPGFMEKAGSLFGAAFRWPIESGADRDPMLLRVRLLGLLAMLGERPAISFLATTAVALSDGCRPLGNVGGAGWRWSI